MLLALLSTAEMFAWRREAMPLAESAALENREAAVTPEAVLSSVFSSDMKTLDNCFDALRAEDSRDFVQTVESLVSEEDCFKLRQWCDDRICADLALDNVDRLPDFQVNVEDLCQVVSAECAEALYRLPDLFDTSFTRVGVFVRRYTPETRCYFPFHCDGNAVTANVALSSLDEYDGGHLRCIVSGEIQTLVRNRGDVTVHKNAVCHAVAPVHRGVRHSLLLFFHSS